MLTKRKKTFITFLIFSLSFIFAFHASAESKKLSPYLIKSLEQIKPEEVYQLAKTISSPSFGGRLTGDKGFTQAAQWAAKKFRQWKLKPLAGSTYLQPYPSPYSVIEEASMSLILPGEATPKVKPLKPVKDFLPLLFSDSGDHEGEVVFAGWGISAPELGYDDYAGLEVKGKFVLCFRGTPDPQDKRFQTHDEHRRRMATAKAKGALGIIYIYPNPLANPNGDRIAGFTPAIISEKIADLIFQEKGLTATKIKKDLLTYRHPLSFPLKAKIHFQVKARYFPEGKGFNIVGYIPGTDPRLKNEFLVYGAHFDHCGTHMGKIFLGADDNASGSAVVMAIARAFAQLKKRPKGSVAFVLFGGEEMGLQGSQYFVDHLPQPLQKIGAMFNFDMVGEGDGVVAIHSPQPEELAQCLHQADDLVQIIHRYAQIRGLGVRGSDYASFFKKGIPCINFVSNGPHLHYHLPQDTIYRLNPDIMAAVARVAFLTGYFWANR
ncbi:MAG: hypothetical protein DRJ11_06480 [Candidatus Aminicenantes bacterium]|nr:MAG: hypothetical protein DRJ11_06480 [Candidatus Aminicenantes bacterium]HHF42299.1 M20/M25/M40 family metallo-hydrolase [Candidatus Aminicenantes bacterium]